MVSKKYILIVDDDDGIREALVDVLQDEGYEVRTAANGNEALGVLRTSAPPSLILLDLMMPVMSGWEFREQQMSDPLLSSIPVYVISAAGNISNAPVPKENFITKPIQLDDLLNVVRQYC